MPENEAIEGVLLVGGPTRWEYHTGLLSIAELEGDEAEHILCDLGEDGWELCGFGSIPGTQWFSIVLKRPLQEEGQDQ